MKFVFVKLETYNKHNFGEGVLKSSNLKNEFPEIFKTTIVAGSFFELDSLEWCNSEAVTRMCSIKKLLVSFLSKVGSLQSVTVWKLGLQRFFLVNLRNFQKQLFSEYLWMVASWHPYKRKEWIDIVTSWEIESNEEPMWIPVYFQYQNVVEISQPERY